MKKTLKEKMFTIQKLLYIKYKQLWENNINCAQNMRCSTQNRSNCKAMKQLTAMSL